MFSSCHFYTFSFIVAADGMLFLQLKMLRSLYFTYKQHIQQMLSIMETNFNNNNNFMFRAPFVHCADIITIYSSIEYVVPFTQFPEAIKLLCRSHSKVCTKGRGNLHKLLTNVTIYMCTSPCKKFALLHFDFFRFR